MSGAKPAAEMRYQWHHFCECVGAIIYAQSGEPCAECGAAEPAPPKPAADLGPVIDGLLADVRMCLKARHMLRWETAWDAYTRRRHAAKALPIIAAIRVLRREASRRGTA